MRQWNWHGSVDEFLALWFKKEHVIDEQLITFVQELRQKGTVCCMATNQEKYRLEYLRHTFADVFSEVFCSAEIGYKKINPQFFTAVAAAIQQKYGIPPEQILLVDDDAGNVQAASAVIAAHHYTSLSELKQVLRHG